ncbi:MAG: hypothetical protein ACW9W4_01070 [Candidatus Nitrosopumilus sp. bin_7KS]
MKYFVIFLILVSFTVFVPSAFGSCISLPCDDANINLGEPNYRFIDFSYQNKVGEPIMFILERIEYGDCTSFNAEIIDEDGNSVWGEGSYALCDPNKTPNLITSQIKIGFNEDNLVTIDKSGKYTIKVQIDGGSIEREFVSHHTISSFSLDRTVYPVTWTFNPLKQFDSGVPFDEIYCKHGLVLVQKHDGSPACVTELTKQKLIERGWAVTVLTSEDFAKHSTLHDGKKNVSKMHVLYSVKKPLGSFETNSFHPIHYQNWDYDFLWKASRYGATYLTDDEKYHYQNVLKPNGTNFAMTNHKGPSYYEMTLAEEYLPVESDLIKFAEYPSDVIEKYGDDMLSHNLGSTGFDEESEDLWIDAMQKPYEWTEVTERGGAFAYNRIGSVPYFQMADGTWVQLYYLGPRMNNHSLFELYVHGYGSDFPLEQFPEQAGYFPPESDVVIRDREGSVSLTISVSDWEEYKQFRTEKNSDYPPPIKVTDDNMHFVYFDMLLELNTPEGFAEVPGRPSEYRKNIDKDYPISSHDDIYDWLRLESGKQYGYSAGGDFSPFFEYRDRLYRISSAIID